MNRSIRLRPALRLQHYRAGVQVQALPLSHVAVRVIQPSLLFVPSLSWQIIGFRMEIECGSDDLINDPLARSDSHPYAHPDALDGDYGEPEPGSYCTETAKGVRTALVPL
jgi:hypothetical protein